MKCVEWHQTKGLLVSGSKDNMIKFWDPRTGTCLSTLCVPSARIGVYCHIDQCTCRHYHKNTVQALAWSPNGNLVASASRDQTVRVFDIRAMKEFRVLKGHKKEVCCTFPPLLGRPRAIPFGDRGSTHDTISQLSPGTQCTPS